MPNIIHAVNYDTDGYRKCGICNLEKPVSAFPRRKTGKYKGALLHCCTECNRERVKKWNACHPGATAKRNHANGRCLPYYESPKCHDWIGIYIAENIAFGHLKGYERAPFGNHGYDFFNDAGKTVDCKASHLRQTSKTGRGWQFAISRNDIADAFFCIAFDEFPSREILYMWFIPGVEIHHMARLSIGMGKRSRTKWEKYRVPV